MDFAFGLWQAGMYVCLKKGGEMFHSIGAGILSDQTLTTVTASGPCLP